jgi:hypothetical protein
MDVEITDRSALARGLREAIGTDQLKMHFQPQFTGESNTITGFKKDSKLYCGDSLL